VTHASSADRLPSTPTAPVGSPAGAAVCTACPLLCDDVVVQPGTAVSLRGCELGQQAFRGIDETTGQPEAWIDGRPATVDDAIAAAAGRLAKAGRVLVTGLGGAAIEGVREACFLAESLDAAIIPGSDEAGRHGGPLIARCGEITAAWEELRDRADLVLFWGHDPASTHPRFIERFVALPLAERARDRRTISIGALSAPPSTRHLQLDGAEDEATLARVLLAGLMNRPCGDLPTGIAAAAATIRAAIDEAQCVAFVTGRHDPVGLSRWAVVELVRFLSQRLPAFEIPLPDPSAGPNAAGAAAVLTWRYGTASGSGAARNAPTTSPPPSAIDLVTAGGLDAIVAVGRLPASLDAAIGRLPAPTSVIRLEPGIPAGTHQGVWIRVGETGQQSGTLLRADGRTLSIAGDWSGDLAPGVARGISAVVAAIRAGLPGATKEAGQ
jgi:formylmethanofuran dehydrogenase subunit B